MGKIDNVETNIENVESDEMTKFVEDNRENLDLITTKDILNQKVKGVVLRIEDDLRMYQGKEILNKHLVMKDNKVFSLNGTAVNKQIIKFFEQNPPPVACEFVVIETTNPKTKNSYREFVARKL